MDYEKEYKEALERVKMRRLAESEDERIRNCIYMCLTDASEKRFNDFHTTLKDCILWLEKQVNKVSPTTKEESELISDWITWINEKRYSQKDVDDAYLKGVWETKQELEKQVNYSAKWKKNSADNKPPLKNSVLIKTTNGFAEGEWQGEHWLQYRWSGILKDRDVLYWMELSELEKLGKED